MATKKSKSLAIGLTGGPGVGKSEVAKILAEYGAVIISADKIGHDLLVKNKIVKLKLIQLLGDQILIDGKLNRPAIGKIVFNNPDTMRSFNEVMHPPLLKSLKNELRNKIMRGTNRLIVVDAALIFEWGIANWFDLLLVVTASRDIRTKRMCNTGLNGNQAAKRIGSQIPQRVKLSLADYVIENNANRSILKRKVNIFIKAIEKYI
jgi:dephospho-CoA kinase